jgi:hypothetical protein
MQRPSKRDWRSVKNWITNQKPLVAREQKFILRKEDLVTLRCGREGAGFESLVEQMLARTDKFLETRLKCKIIKVGRSCRFLRVNVTDLDSSAFS